MASWSVVDEKRLVHHDDAVGRGVLQYPADSNEIVLQLPSKIRDVLFAFEVRKQPVEQKQTSLRARNQAAEARKVVHLTERAGQGRLATLVGTGHDQDSLRPPQEEIVADHGSLFGNELAGQGDIEHLDAPDFLGGLRESGRQKGSPTRRNPPTYARYAT